MKQPKVSEEVTVEEVCSSGCVSMTFVTVVSSPNGEDITLVTTVVTVVLRVKFLSKICCWSVATLFESGITTTSYFFESFSPVTSVILFAEDKREGISRDDRFETILTSSLGTGKASTILVSLSCCTTSDSLVG
jgi:hypothetical protein